MFAQERGRMQSQQDTKWVLARNVPKTEQGFTVVNTTLFLKNVSPKSLTFLDPIYSVIS